MHRIAALVLALTGALTTACRPEEIGPKPDILVDRIHAWKQHPGMHLDTEQWEYQGMHGYHDLFEHLEVNGYTWSNATESNSKQGLTAERLADVPVLFINLVSDDMPDFTDEEVTAIQDYVHDGGGLFLITDHSNVYHHAERVNPILKPMGIEMMFATMVGDGQGSWIRFTDFEEHPMSEGVGMASFLSGGPFLSDHVVAWSPPGFADDWDDTNKPTLTGNHVWDEDEPVGPLPVVVAAEYGKGRVAAVGDQNLFGDLWLYMNDNFELACNTFEWLAKREGERVRDALSAELLVGFELEHSGWSTASTGCNGAFPFYVDFNRVEGVVARGITALTPDFDVLVLVDPYIPYHPDEIDLLRAVLADGGAIVLTTDLAHPAPGTVQLLETFTPALEIRSGGTTYTLADLSGGADLATTEGTDLFPVRSDVLAVDGFALATLDHPGACLPEADSPGVPTLHDLQTDLGEPLLQATVDGATVDLIRTVEIDGGTLILVVQDGFWRNTTLGDHNTDPMPMNRDAHLTEFAFVEWLLATYGTGR